MFQLWQRAAWGLLLFASAASAYAQETSWADSMFERTSVDFGSVAKGADTKQRLAFTNKFKETVHVQSVAASCGCISPRLLNDTLASRETGYIELSLNTIQHQGEKNVFVTVTVDAPYYASVRIPIHAFIRTDVVITPGAAQFGSVSKGSSQERKVQIAYAGRENWRITNYSCKNPHLAVKFSELGRGIGRVDYEMSVSLKPTAPVGDLREQIVLFTDDPGNPQVPVIVEARIEPEYTVSPEVVSFGEVAPGQRKTINVVVRGRRPFQIQKVESEKAVGAFEVRMPADPKLIHIIPLTLIAPAQQGSINERFSLSIKEVGEPITFRVVGKIVGQTLTQNRPLAH